MTKALPMLACLIVAAITGACKSIFPSHQDSKAESTPQKDTVYVVVENQQENEDSLLIGYERTPCFGQCPVYKVRIYSNGFARYEGINFVEKIGHYAAQLDSAQLAELKKRIKALRPADLQKEYDDPRITDLPSQKLIFQIGNERKYVTARAHIPDHLGNFLKYMQELSEKTRWKPDLNRN